MYVELSDADLAPRIAGGDREAEAEMCRRMAPRIRLYGLRHLRSAPAADDLVQQVLLTVLEALRVYTYNSAYTAFEEGEKGSLEEGKLADLAVLAEDLLALPPTRLRDLQVDQTYVDGRLVYERTPAASDSNTSLRNGSRANSLTALRIEVRNCRVDSSVRAIPTTANRSGSSRRYASE